MLIGNSNTAIVSSRIGAKIAACPKRFVVARSAQSRYFGASRQPKISSSTITPQTKSVKYKMYCAREYFTAFSYSSGGSVYAFTSFELCCCACAEPDCCCCCAGADCSAKAASARGTGRACVQIAAAKNSRNVGSTTRAWGIAPPLSPSDNCGEICG